MAQMSFTTNAKTDLTIKELKDAFGVETSAEAVRLALGLARMAVRRRDPEENTVTIVEHDRSSGEDVRKETAIALGL